MLQTQGVLDPPRTVSQLSPPNLKVNQRSPTTFSHFVVTVTSTE